MSQRKLIKTAGLHIAEAVYNAMSTLDLGDEECNYILTDGFYNYKCTGYHFSDVVSGRGCTVVNNPVTDQIRLVYGSRADFNPDTYHAAVDTAFVDIHPDDVYHAASQTLGWLLDGRAPLNTCNFTRHH